MKKSMQTTLMTSMKRALAVLLVLAATVTGFSACDIPSDDPLESMTKAPTKEPATEPETEPEKVLITEPITYPLRSDMDGVKILGERHLASETMITCDWTGSGFEIDVEHHGGDITFTASATSDCLFRAYVDGEEWAGSTYKADPELFHVTKSLTDITLKDVPAGERRIKLIKVTGYTIARAQVHDISFCGTISKYCADPNELYIEFVGDSICCAWGTIGNHQGTYTDQDGTLAYPLKIAERLSADYSVTALSGQGLIYGPSCSMAEGYLYPSPLRNKNKEYTFERKADIVVINIGTNDYSNRSSANIDKAKFKAAYLAFLKTVAEKNGPNCQIYCLYNTMNDTFKDAIIEAVAEFGGEEKNVYTYQMTKAASGHPTIAENEKYTEDLLKLMGLT